MRVRLLGSMHRRDLSLARLAARSFQGELLACKQL